MRHQADSDPAQHLLLRGRSRPKRLGAVLSSIVCLLLVASVTPSALAQRIEPELVLVPEVGDIEDGTFRTPGFSADLPTQVAEMCPSSSDRHANLSLRDHLGLENKRPSGDLVEMFGIAMTPAEVALIESVDQTRKVDQLGLREAAESIAAQSYIGLDYTVATGVFTIHVAPGLKSDVVAAAIADRAGIDSAGIEVRVVQDGIPAQKALANYERLNAAGLDLLDSPAEISMFMLDSTCGYVFVYVKPELVGKADSVISRYIDTSEAVILPMSEADRITPALREDSHNPQVGGAAVGLSPTSSTAMGCTINIPWYKTNGEWWGVTAAHCLPSQPGYVSGAWGLTFQNWYQGTDIDINGSGTSGTYFAYGGELDMAVVQIDRPGKKNTITHVPTIAPRVESQLRLDYFHWSTSMDVPGYMICQAGKTSNNKKCGPLNVDRYSANYTSNQSGIGEPISVNNMFIVDVAGQLGDSGGTVWHQQSNNGDDNLVGVLHGRSPSTFVYSHVAYLNSIYGLHRPAEMN